MGQKFSRFLLTKVMKWEIVKDCKIESKGIVLGVPHTSIWDFIITYFYCNAIGEKVKVMIKKELFFWPLGPIIKALGGIPIDRKHSTGVVKQVIDQFKSSDKFLLCIAPEGTRKPVKRWKTGFHSIAKAAEVPVYLGFFDWKNKRIGVSRTFEISDNPKADLLEIQRYYKSLNMDGKHKGHYLFMDEV